MVVKESPDLNVLAGHLENEFQKWIQLDPLAPCPKFSFGSAGPDLGLPRFGVARAADHNTIIIDSAYTSVISPIILREVVRTYFPAHCLVDFIDDMINHFGESFLTSILPDIVYDVTRWQTLVQNHSRTYHVHYLGAPISSRLDTWPHKLRAFQIFLGKLRQHATLLTPDRVLEISVIITSAIIASTYDHTYSQEDAEFTSLLSDYMRDHAEFPSLKRLAKATPEWSYKRCKAVARRLEEDPISATYLQNPNSLNLVLCWIFIETSPAVNSYIVRNLTFLPFATMTFCQCVGTPLPTYFTVNFFAPSQLDEFGTHLAGLKQKGVLLDYQILRVEREFDVLNWSDLLAVQAPTPLISMMERKFRPESHDPQGLSRSWFVRQIIPFFQQRKYTPTAMSNWDPEQNYRAFCRIVEGTAILFTTDVDKDLGEVMPLIEQYRNVDYVLHLLNLAMELLRYLHNHPEIVREGQVDFGKLGFTWKYFPAREWLLVLFHESNGDNARQADMLSKLDLATRILGFFSSLTIPREAPPNDYLRGKLRVLKEIIKEEIAALPGGDKARLHYFSNLHDQIVRDGLVIPNIALSPFFPFFVEDFYCLVRTSRTFEELTAEVRARLSSLPCHARLLEFSDPTGACVFGGIIHATQEQFSVLQRALVGPKGVLGPDASILIGRRVPSWLMTTRSALAYDFTTQSYASIADYLSLMRAEHLAGWVRPRKMPLPYVRKILTEPFQGSVERASHAAPSTMHLTPQLVANLKAAFLNGTRSLHNFAVTNLKGQWSCDLDWSRYGLERYFLHVFLSTRNPKYIFSHLVTPATRRILVSTAVSGFQTVLLEYLWPKGAPDDKFLQYLYSRTEKNVLAYSVHRVLSDTRFFNLDKVQRATNEEHAWDNIDMIILMLARSQDSGRIQATEFSYGGDTHHAPGGVGWEMAADYFAAPSKNLPPDGRAVFDFDPRTIGFTEKTALFFRGDFDALSLCQALPIGHYYRTEEIAFEGTERLAGQVGHIILFDFPAVRAHQINTFLDDFLRNPAVIAHTVTSYLVPQSPKKIQGFRLDLVNPLKANPYDPRTGSYYHLPKRLLRDGKWHTLPLKDQASLLHQAWSKNHS